MKSRLPGLFFVIVVAVVLGLLFWRFPYIALDTNQKRTLLYTVGLLILLGGSASLSYRGKGWDFLRHLLCWSAVLLVIMTGYSYRDILLNNRIISSLIPQRAIIAASGEVMFRAASDGHFYMETRINNTLVKFMVDTGASDITLSAADAVRIGLQPESLAYTHSYHTANGVISGAPVILDEFVVGPITLRNMPASVNKADMGTSLLGMAFFRQLQGFSVEGDVLTLKP